MFLVGNLGNPPPPILTRKNYEVRSPKMRTFIRLQDYWEVVVIGFTKLDPVNLAAMTNAKRQVVAENRRRDSLALYYIQQGLEDSILPNIGATDHPKKAWDILEIVYQRSDKVKMEKLQTLRKCFETLLMKDFDSMDHFLT